jgi:hypothetical protein
MSGQWRSTAAQTFVSGRITQIDGFWSSHKSSAALMEVIETWDLWHVVWGARASEKKKIWKKYTTGGSAFSRFKSKASNLLGTGSDRQLGKEIFDALEQDICMPIQRIMDYAGLTINFNAQSWFGNQAGFDSYISMWDRIKSDSALDAYAATKGGKQNPADWRAKADRHAIYGQFGSKDVKDSGMQLPHVKEVRAFESYKFSASKPAPTDSQLFTALNYGMRPNGASTEYGRSYFELENKYKQNAIYFAMDTFTPVFGKRDKKLRGKLYQANYGSFGGAILLAIMEQYKDNQSAVLEKHSKELITNLMAAKTKKLPNTKENHLLIEAHIFEKVEMNAQCIKKVIVAKSELGKCIDNLEKFKRDTGIPYGIIDDTNI